MTTFQRPNRFVCDVFGALQPLFLPTYTWALNNKMIDDFFHNLCPKTWLRCDGVNSGSQIPHLPSSFKGVILVRSRKVETYLSVKRLMFKNMHIYFLRKKNGMKTVMLTAGLYNRSCDLYFKENYDKFNNFMKQSTSSLCIKCKLFLKQNWVQIVKHDLKD